MKTINNTLAALDEKAMNLPRRYRLAYYILAPIFLVILFLFRFFGALRVGISSFRKDFSYDILGTIESMSILIEVASPDYEFPKEPVSDRPKRGTGAA